MSAGNDRTRFVIVLAVSLLLHLGALAAVVLRVPLLSDRTRPLLPMEVDQYIAQPEAVRPEPAGQSAPAPPLPRVRRRSAPAKVAGPKMPVPTVAAPVHSPRPPLAQPAPVAVTPPAPASRPVAAPGEGRTGQVSGPEGGGNMVLPPGGSPGGAGSLHSGGNGPTAGSGTPGNGRATGGKGAAGSGAGRTGYETLLRRLIEAHKSYPFAARRAGWEGRCQRRFTLARSGRLLRVESLSSCGHPMLDRAATRAIADAAPFPPLPASYPGTEVSFTLPMTFSLSGR